MEYRPTVLEEDEYTAAIEKIIRRDFFPDLPKLEMQAEILDARQHGDTERYRMIMEKYQKYAVKNTPRVNATPAGFESPASFSSSFTPIIRGDGEARVGSSTPLDSSKHSSEDASSANVNTDLSLDQFLMKYTSEDDASFEVILEKQNEAKRLKHAWMYDKTGIQPLLIEGSKDERPHLIESWQYNPKNMLMYYPDGEKPDIASLPPKREINHNATRVFKVPGAPVRPGQSVASTPSSGSETPTNDALERYLSKKKHPDGKFDLDAMRKTPGKEWGDDASDNGTYPLVATPSPMPGSGGESPFMTWGQIESTPLILDPSSSPLNGPSFKIPETPKREQIAIRLSEDATRKLRDRQNPTNTLLKKHAVAKGAASPRLLSPAAQRLAKATLASTRQGSDSQLRQSYRKATPSPRSTPSASSSVNKGNQQRTAQTPQHSGETSVETQKPETSVTDDLLTL
eukprot:TRINITY_DN2594_c0_g1_i2.p1 TRINITY_DN2594_c0_g1~~TRINITY_DN2594_c0_g1_i2.p1  ORF type:complete len:457 (-),score=110.67 TRINITY_DN2594_c0_g1_i2:171-1541(-)